MKTPVSSTQPAAVIVHERNRLWAPLFRQNMPDHPVVETRIWDNLIVEIMARPGSVLCIEAENAKIEEIAMQIRRLRSRFFDSPLIVACQRTSKNNRWIALESGANAVVCSPMDVRKISSALVGHFEGIVPPDRPLEQSIYDRLPWKNQATKN